MNESLTPKVFYGKVEQWLNRSVRVLINDTSYVALYRYKFNSKLTMILWGITNVETIHGRVVWSKMGISSGQPQQDAEERGNC